MSKVSKEKPIAQNWLIALLGKLLVAVHSALCSWLGLVSGIAPHRNYKRQ